MPWIIGLIDEEEKKRIVKAGYEVESASMILGPKNFEAVWVDCDVADLLELKNND
jgi:hypothetical protein